MGVVMVVVERGNVLLRRGEICRVLYETNLIRPENERARAMPYSTRVPGDLGRASLCCMAEK